MKSSPPSARAAWGRFIVRVRSGSLARFHREAQVLASLNHPNIAAIYGFEDSGDTHALVLELVEGPTLVDRIARGPLPVDEALAIAAQIAEALEVAHEQGIIHRDLKPANIKVTPAGIVKVLDFGLAKALDPAPATGINSLSPTITSPALTTGIGVLLGTAAYMSPEQARGKAVDKRAERRTLVWVDRTGRSTPLFEREAAYRAPRLSPEGKRAGLPIRRMKRGGRRSISRRIQGLEGGSLYRPSGAGHPSGRPMGVSCSTAMADR